MIRFLLPTLILLGAVHAEVFTDVDGVSHDTAGQNVIIVIGNTNCPPLDNMIRFQLADLKKDYPDILALAVFPCTNAAPLAVKAWQARVPGASNFCPVEIDARVPHPLLSAWQEMGYPQYGGFIYGKSGVCATRWSFWRSRQQLEPELTRQLHDLRICLSNGVPRATWRHTLLPWELQWRHVGDTHTATLVLR